MHELHLGPTTRPTARFALRPVRRTSARPLFIPPHDTCSLPAAVLPLTTYAGTLVTLAALAQSHPDATLREAALVTPGKDEAPAATAPAVWIEGLDEPALDALRRAYDLLPGYRITADERVHSMGSDAGALYLVPLPRIVLQDHHAIADNSDPTLSMAGLLDDFVSQFLDDEDTPLRHLRLATGYLYQRGLYRLLRLLARHPELEIHLLFSGQTDRASATLLTGQLTGQIQAAVDAARDHDLADVCREALAAGRLKVRVYADTFLHAKLFVGWDKLNKHGLPHVGHASVGSSNLSGGGLHSGGNLELNVSLQTPEMVKRLMDWFEARWAEADEPQPALLEVVEKWRPEPEPVFETQGLKDVWTAGHDRRLAPPEAYLTLLAQLYGRRVEQIRPIDIAPFPDVPRMLDPSPEQVAGVQNLAYRLRGTRLGFLADSVGLGKTITALGTAWFLDRAGVLGPAAGRPRWAVIAPRKLFHQWRSDAHRIGMTEPLACLNRHKLERETDARAVETLAGYQLLLVDEAHEVLRNRGNKLWRHLRAWLRDHPTAMVLLISATPWNNSREDIFSYLALAWADDRRLRPHFPALDVAPLATHLDLFNGAGAKGARAFVELDQSRYDQLFGAAFVQRTRNSVQRRYGGAPDFPERGEPFAETTPPSEAHDAFFVALDRALAGVRIPYREPFAAMQRALSEVAGDKVEAPPASNLHGSFVLQLYKRAESSIYALAISLARIATRLTAFETTLTEIQGSSDPKSALEHWLSEVYLRIDPLAAVAADAADAAESEDTGDAEPDADAEALDEPGFRLRAQPTSAEELRRQNLKGLLDRVTPAEIKAAVRHLIDGEIASDVAILTELRGHLSADLDRSDPKLQVLLEAAKQHYHKGHKPVLVAAYADTALRVFLRLVDRFRDARIGLALGGGEAWVHHPGSHRADDLSDTEWTFSLGLVGVDRRHRLLTSPPGPRAQLVARDDLLAAFAPKAQRDVDGISRHRVGGEIDILVGSEAISVGQNLQDSTALIHLDLPWNPMILEQRIGRIDRRGGGRVEAVGDRKVVDIHYCWSTAAVESEVNLRERLKEKTKGAMRDTHFDELLLKELIEETRQARSETERRERAAHVLGSRQRALVEERERVEGTSETSGSEMDGLRLLSEWRAAHPGAVTRSSTPGAALACGQIGSGDGPSAQWLLTLRLVPIGANGRPFSETVGLTAHVALPIAFDEAKAGALGPDLDAVVSGLLGASAPSVAPDVPPRTWRSMLLHLDRAVQAARKCTLAAHNEAVRLDRDRALKTSGPRDAGERLKIAARNAEKAIYAQGILESDLRRMPRGQRIRTLVGPAGLLAPHNVWRLLRSDLDESAAELHLSRIAANPRAFWHESFDELWAALFADVADETPPAPTEPAQPDLIASLTTQTWQDLRVEVLAAAYVAV